MSEDTEANGTERRFLLFTFLKRAGHALPGRATQESTTVRRQKETRSKHRPQL